MKRLAKSARSLARRRRSYAKPTFTIMEHVLDEPEDSVRARAGSFGKSRPRFGQEARLYNPKGQPVALMTSPRAKKSRSKSPSKSRSRSKSRSASPSSVSGISPTSRRSSRSRSRTRTASRSPRMPNRMAFVSGHTLANFSRAHVDPCTLTIKVAHARMLVVLKKLFRLHGIKYRSLRRDNEDRDRAVRFASAADLRFYLCITQRT
jgi:hypothetical protein